MDGLSSLAHMIAAGGDYVVWYILYLVMRQSSVLKAIRIRISELETWQENHAKESGRLKQWW
jgi:hypothetical protein